MEERTAATRWLGMALGLVVVVAIGAAVGVAMPGVWGRGEPAPVVLEEGAPLVVDKAALRTIDLAEVHEELVPSWVVARGGMRELQLKTLSKALQADRSLVAIAERIGWQDKTHFIRQFRKEYGQTPAAWRRAQARVSEMDQATTVSV